jgi:hypothetical protein
VSEVTFNAVKAKLPEPAALDSERDERSLGRIYGEDLPSGLILSQ